VDDNDDNNRSNDDEEGVVRPDRVAIGLFLPQSHKLVPVPNCAAHHPSINRAMELITRACHNVGVAPYWEEDDDNEDDRGGGGGTGVGQLRYVAINVARKTGGLQITLVWNAPHPPTSDDDIGTLFDDDKQKLDNDSAATATAIDDPDLRKLVTRLISMSSKKDYTDDGMMGTIGLHIANLVSSLVCSDENSKKRNDFAAPCAHCRRTSNSDASIWRRMRRR